MNEMSLKYSVAWISRNIVLGLEQRLVGLFNVRLECVEKAKDNRLVGKISVINNVSREIVAELVLSNKDILENQIYKIDDNTSNHEIAFQGIDGVLGHLSNDEKYMPPMFAFRFCHVVGDDEEDSCILL